MDRRRFLLESAGATSAVLAASAPWRASAGARSARGIRFGCAAITWGGNDAQAIDDIAALGFAGIQLRDSAVRRWGKRPAELRSLLAERKLTLVALSSGGVTLDPAKEKETVALHVSHARFVKDAGGLYLQVTDERPAGRGLAADDYRRMGRLLTEIGRQAAELGVTLGLHPHMGALSQSPGEVARVLDAADPHYVKLELDIAHYAQAGGNPADAIRTYAKRLLFLHIKDVESPAPGGAADSYRFVELGRGRVDIRGVFAALREVAFDGWAVVELDDVPDGARTPKESAEISRKYLAELGLIAF